MVSLADRLGSEPILSISVNLMVTLTRRGRSRYVYMDLKYHDYYLQLMRGYLEKSHSKHVMPTHLQVLAALHFYNTGNQDDTRLSDNIQIAQTSFYHAVKEVRLVYEK